MSDVTQVETGVEDQDLTAAMAADMEGGDTPETDEGEDLDAEIGEDDADAEDGDDEEDEEEDEED